VSNSDNFAQFWLAREIIFDAGLMKSVLKRVGAVHTLRLAHRRRSDRIRVLVAMSASCAAAFACHAVAPTARVASHRASRVSRPALMKAKKKNASTPRAARAAASSGGSASHAPGLRAVWSIDAK
jgi:hypothetical protein